MTIPAKKQNITFGKFQNVDMRVGVIRSAARASEAAKPSRHITIDLGPLGEVTSVGQFALIEEAELVGKRVVVCINLGERQMGPYLSQVLVLGAPHPDSPPDQAQATPIFVDDAVAIGSQIF